MNLTTMMWDVDGVTLRMGELRKLIENWKTELVVISEMKARSAAGLREAWKGAGI